MTNSNRLLYFASDWMIGLSSLLTDEVTALYEAGVDLIAVASENEQEPGLTERINNAGIPIIRIPGLDEHKNFGILVNQVALIVKDEGIRIVHVQNNWQLAIVNVVKCKARCNLKVIYTLHAFRHNSPIKSKIAKVVIGSALMIGASKVRCMCTYLKNEFWFLGRKNVLLPLGVANSFFNTMEYSLPQNGLHMVFPAQFRKGKQQEMLIEAFGKHCKECNDNVSTLTLPGSGRLEKEMKALSIKLGVEQQVKFPGLLTKEQVLETIINCNIGLVSSNSETFGQAIVEPYVMGRCMVTTPVGVALDIIENGRSGYIFHTIEELTDIFNNLYRHQERITSIGTYNFKHRDIFKWSRIANEYKNLLSSM